MGENKHDVPWTHAGGEVEGVGVGVGVGVLAESLVQSLGGFGRVENEEAALGGVCEDVGNKIVVVKLTKVFAEDAFESAEKCGFILDDGSDFLWRDSDVEIAPAVESGLGGSAENGGGVKVVNKATESAQDGMKERGGESLNFVENDDRAGDVVELATGTGTIRVERFEELDVGRDGEWSIPIFRGEAVLFGFVFWIELGMVFEDDFSLEFFGKAGKNGAKNIRVLCDDTGERDDEDDTVVAVFQSVAEGKEKRGEGFPAAGGNGEGEEAGWLVCGLDAIKTDSFAGLIDTIIAGWSELFGHVVFERLEHTSQNVIRPRLAKIGPLRRHERFGG